MMQWVRQKPVKPIPASLCRETWSRGDQSFDMEVLFSKPLDVLALKGTDLSETRDYAAFLSKTAARLFESDIPREVLTVCPVCGHSTADAVQVLRVFDIPYLRCGNCGHGFVQDRPTEAAMKTLFVDSEAHSAVYIDHSAIEKRLAQIVTPKLDWVTKIFLQHVGRFPASVIDVGAGGGHFLSVASKAGLTVEGFELSRASREFAASAFGLNLRADNYLSATPGPVDLVTYWGLLEYVSNPPDFISAARKRLHPDNGLLVVEVPRIDAVGTVVQACNPNGVARHMDPTSHINCFSDLSLVTALVNGGFRPVAAWYFGLDAYELLSQVALMSGKDDLLKQCAALIPTLQEVFDRSALCDDVIIASVPL